MITQKQLKSRYHYNEKTGIFTRISTGNIAGSLNCRYLAINFDRKKYYNHRLAWLYVHGELPEGSLDHINHNRFDNSIENLRETDQLTNSKNISIGSANISGHLGVHWLKKDKVWAASIMVKQKGIWLGRFKDKFEAIDARLHAEKLYGFHANHGKT